MVRELQQQGLMTAASAREPYVHTLLAQPSGQPDLRVKYPRAYEFLVKEHGAIVISFQKDLRVKASRQGILDYVPGRRHVATYQPTHSIVS